MSAPSTRSRAWRAVLALCLLTEFLVLLLGLLGQQDDHVLWTEAAGAFVFLLALVALRRSDLPLRSALGLVLVGGLAFQIAALPGAAASSSDDVFRYVWDGKVQLAGTDPYRYTPADPALRSLRSEALFPTDRPRCAWKLRDGQCTLINRPDVPTVYPPVAEGAFTLARVLSLGRTDSVLPLQSLAVLGVLGIGLLLARWVRRVSGPPWWVAVWLWCPATAVEFANNGHIDWLGVLFALAALWTAAVRRPVWSGVFAGAAILTKLYPGLVLPCLVRRSPVRVVAAAFGLAVLTYLPHVLAVGPKVIGYVPKYLSEEQYGSGRRFMLLDRVLPTVLTAPVAVLIVVGALAWALWRVDPDRPERTAVVVVGVSMLVSTPSYAWYALLLLGLVAMTGAVEWLGIVLVAPIAMIGAGNFGDGVTWRSSWYAVGLLWVVAVAGYRHRARIAARLRSAQRVRPGAGTGPQR